MERPTEDDSTLIERYKNGDLSASFLLLIKYYKYILKRILEITNGHWFSEDILQAGAVGLFEAAKRFNQDLGYTFLTYADSWIKKYIYIQVRNELLPMGGIAIGRDAKELLFNYIKLLLQGKDDQEIINKLKITPKKLQELKIMNVTAARIKSLDYIPTDAEDEEGTDPYNFIDITQISPLDEVTTSQLTEFIEKTIQEIKKEQPIAGAILNMKLGLNGQKEKTKQEICKKLKLKTYEYTKWDRYGNKQLRKKLIDAGWYDKI